MTLMLYVVFSFAKIKTAWFSDKMSVMGLQINYGALNYFAKYSYHYISM